jgi:L-asparaginase
MSTTFHPWATPTAQDGVIVVLATGGTISGEAASATDNLGYTAGKRSAQDLVRAVPALADWPLETEQVAQIDSKDMRSRLWLHLSHRLHAHLARPEVRGVVITHGTDTLEETAWWLHRTLLSDKPVVLTAAMRPATSLQADGPQNLLDAVRLASLPDARGLMLVVGGEVLAASECRKVYGQRLRAFDTADGVPLGHVSDEGLRQGGVWPLPAVRTQGAGRLGELQAWWRDLPGDTAAWPWVAIVSSHADADERQILALAAAGVNGLVVSCTGHGTVHKDLEPVLAQAQDRGIGLIRASRCGLGRVTGADHPSLPSAGGLTPAQARVELLLRLLDCPTATSAQPL